MKLVDTSVIIRFLARDDPVKAERVRKLFLQSEEELLVSDMSFWETVYVLERIYGKSREEIFNLLAGLLSSQRLEFEHGKLLFQALALYREHGVPFADAWQVALARDRGAEAVYTYDRHFGSRLRFPSREP